MKNKIKKYYNIYIYKKNIITFYNPNINIKFEFI